MLSLLSPWFLVGLGALAAPILVHLIQKQRKEVTPFPSLMFIQQIPYQSVSRQRIRHWLLFLMRCLAIILLVLAFAHPFFPSRHTMAGSGLPPGGRDIVIAMDRSYSMAYGDRWRRATAAAKDVIEHMSGSDRATIVYFAGTAWLSGDLTDDKSSLTASVDSAGPTDGVTRYDAALRLVQRVFGDTARPHHEVVLISDAQRSGLTGREMPSLPLGTKFTQVYVGDNATSDVAVTDVDVRYDTTTGRERVSIEASLANHGAIPVRQRPVTFELNGRPMQTRLVDCPADGVVRVQFEPVAIAPGLSRGVVHIGPDALPANNNFYFTVTHKSSLPVLLVQSADAGATGGRFLSLALGIGRRVTFRVRTIRPDQLVPAALRGTSLIVLNDTPMPGGELGHQIVDFVRGGGGLFVVLGPRSKPGAWPALADQLIPRPVEPVVARVNDHGATMEVLERTHAMFEAFNASHTGDFSSARFQHYWAVKAQPGDQPLARFDDGRAALLERHVGAGRVLIWTSDLDGGWNDFPLQPVFLPVIQQAAKYSAGYGGERRWMVVGDALNPETLFGESLPNAGGDAATAAAQQPASGGAQYVVITPSRTQIRFNKRSARASMELTQQGFYSVIRSGVAGDSTLTVAANVDPEESDLTPLDTARLAAAVAPHVTAVEQQRAKVPGDLGPIDLERRQGVWWYLLAIALLLLGVETLFSNRLSRPVRPVRATR